MSTAGAVPPKITTRPLIGVAGVLLGAMIATVTGRLMSVGLVDIRGALHLGVDEASWIGTAFNAALMFIGPFSVYLGGLLGPRRVLLACAAVFTLISFVLPLVSSLPVMLFLLVGAGLTAGTFYPLTLSFVLRNLPMKFVLLGIAMYAVDIVFTTNVATSLEACYMNHLSWRWIFWTGGALTPVMMLLVHFGIPWQPLHPKKEGQLPPSWRGFTYASLGFAALYVALDQGQRLDWSRSGVIVAFTATGVSLCLAALVRHSLLPNALLNYRFLLRRNTLLLSGILILFRFCMLGTVLAIPSYLGSVSGYVPLQTGPVLLWVAVPQIFVGLAAMALLWYLDARMILTAGFSLVAVACLLDAHLSSAWSGRNFASTQLIMATGLAFAFNALVGCLVLEVINTGALSRPVDVLTFAGFFQTVRLFGGEAGTAFMQHFIAVREQFHSNMLGLHIQLGLYPTDQRLLELQAGMASHATGVETATQRAAAILSLQLKQQAFTLAITDSFTLIAWSTVGCLLLISGMGRVATQYLQITRTSAIEHPSPDAPKVQPAI